MVKVAHQDKFLLNNDGSLDVIGMIGSTQNVAYLSGNNATSFSISELFDRKQQVADLNNDGKLEWCNQYQRVFC